MAIVVAGLDGFQKRWLCVLLKDGAFVEAEVFDSLSQAAEALTDASVIAVDIPIGFPTGYGRQAEHEAKAFLGPRRNSVFLTLPRAVYEASSYEEAGLLARRLLGKGLNKLSYELRHKMLEADVVAVQDARVIEVHPEVSFRELARQPLTHAKSTWTGLMVRRGLLCDAGIVVPAALPGGGRARQGRRKPGRPGDAAPDDVLDAAAAAWTAHRKARGEALRLPATPPCNASEGCIWY